MIDSEDTEVFQFKKQIAICRTSATKAANVTVTTKEPTKSQKESDESPDIEKVEKQETGKNGEKIFYQKSFGS